MPNVRFLKVYRNKKNRRTFFYNEIKPDIDLPKDEKQKDLFISAIMDGGLSKDKDISNIPEEKIRKGIEVEMEHVDRNNTFAYLIARKISIDHLIEDINYYEKLAKMENK